MESITTAELLELIFLAHHSVEKQFIYWMAISFVVVAGRFTVNERPSKKLRISITAIYLAIVTSLVIRWTNAGINLAMLLLEASDRGIDMSSSLIFNIQANLILAIYAFGTALTVWFLNSNTKRFEAA